MYIQPIFPVHASMLRSALWTTLLNVASGHILFHFFSPSNPPSAPAGYKAAPLRGAFPDLRWSPLHECWVCGDDGGSSGSLHSLRVALLKNKDQTKQIHEPRLYIQYIQEDARGTGTVCSGLKEEAAEWCFRISKSAINHQASSVQVIFVGKTKQHVVVIIARLWTECHNVAVLR